MSNQLNETFKKHLGLLQTRLSEINQVKEGSNQIIPGTEIPPIGPIGTDHETNVRADSSVGEKELPGSSLAMKKEDPNLILNPFDTPETAGSEIVYIFYLQGDEEAKAKERGLTLPPTSKMTRWGTAWITKDKELAKNAAETFNKLPMAVKQPSFKLPA